MSELFDILVVKEDDPIESRVKELGLEDCRIILNDINGVRRLEGYRMKRAYISEAVLWDGIDRDLLDLIERTLTRYSIPLSRGIRIMP